MGKGRGGEVREGERGSKMVASKGAGGDEWENEFYVICVTLPSTACLTDFPTLSLGFVHLKLTFYFFFFSPLSSHLM